MTTSQECLEVTEIDHICVRGVFHETQRRKVKQGPLYTKRAAASLLIYLVSTIIRPGGAQLIPTGGDVE